MNEGHVVELSLHLRAAPERVFPYLTEPERYARWQGVRAELDPRPGGIYRVWMATGTVAVGEYVEVEPPRRVVFTWGWEGDPELPPGTTTVEIDLRPESDGTILTLRHSGLPTSESTALHEAGWNLFGARLADVVAGRVPGPMPPP